MAQDNVLGAPTEGLGQTVTFSFDSRNGVPTLQPVDSGNYRGGVHGSPVAGGLQLSAPNAQIGPNPTVALLMKAGEGVIDKHISRIRTEQFVSGMQRAMTGEAVKDIADQQPWYSRIFGDSAVVEGARQFAQQANVTNAIAKIEEDMPEVRRLPAAEASSYFADVVQKSLTGEPGTDAAIMSAYARTMPSLMKRQVKEHYGWKQEEASKAESQMINSMATRLQGAGQAHARGMIDDTEYAALTAEVIQASRPAEGRDEKSWQHARAADMVGMAKRRELHALNAFVGQGMLDVLTPQQATAVLTAQEAAERSVRARYDEEWGDRLIDLRTRAAIPEEGSNTQELLAQVDAVNAEYNKLTGSKQGLIGAAERAALGTRSATAIIEAQRREAERQATAARAATTSVDKAQKESGMDAVVLKAFHQESLHMLKSEEGYSDDRINRVLTASFMNNADPNVRAAFIQKAHSTGHVVKPVAETLAKNVRLALQAGPQALDGAIMPVYEQWKAVYNRDPSAAHSYYGAYATKMARFHQAIEAGVPVAGAYAIFSERDERSKLDKKEAAVAVKEVEGAFSGLLPSWMPLSKSLQPGQAELAVDLLAGDIEVNLATYKDPKVAAEITVKTALARGTLESMGGYVWGLNNQGTTRMKALSAYLTDSKGGTRVPFGSDGEKADEMFAAAVDAKLYGAGDKAGIIPQNALLGQKAEVTRLWRMNDVDGEPMFWLHAIADGKRYDAAIRGSELFTLREAAKAARSKQTRPRGGSATELRRGAYVATGE